MGARDWALPRQDTALLLPSDSFVDPAAAFAARSDWPAFGIPRDLHDRTVYREFYFDRQGTHPQIDYYDRTVYSSRTRGAW